MSADQSNERKAYEGRGHTEMLDGVDDSCMTLRRSRIVRLRRLLAPEPGRCFLC